MPLLILIILAFIYYFFKDLMDSQKYSNNTRPTATTNPQNTINQIGNFYVQNGTLIKYTGRESVVVIPENVRIIGKEVFKHSYAKSIIIPNTVFEIQPNAFVTCLSLTTITIPASVRKIGNSAFRDCYNLGKVDWLINYHGRSTQRNMDSAVRKWTQDRDFVAQYDVSSRRNVQIGSITHRENN